MHERKQFKALTQTETPLESVQDYDTYQENAQSNREREREKS